MAQHQATGKGFSDEQRWCLAQMAAEHIAPTSSVRAAFDLATSDLDFLVEFDDLPPAEYADAYFSLKEKPGIALWPVALVTEVRSRKLGFSRLLR